MSSTLMSIDSELIGSIIFNFRSGKSSEHVKDPLVVKFQFPPRFINDNRSGNWIESQLRGDEPIAIYGSSGSREISMKWTYIAGARGGKNNEVFSPYVISKQIQDLRGYFSSPYASMTLADALVVRFQMWYHTGFNQFTCRIKSIDVSYGRALITDRGPFGSASGNRQEENQGINSYSPKRTYALRTDVIVEMRLWTRNGGEDVFSKDEAKKMADKLTASRIEKDKLSLNGLKPTVPADWQ